MLLYCPRCRRRTTSHDLIDVESRNGKPMLQGRCDVCETRKSCIVSKAVLEKFLDNDLDRFNNDVIIEEEEEDERYLMKTGCRSEYER